MKYVIGGLVLLFLLAGCGSDESDPSNPVTTIPDSKLTYRARANIRMASEGAAMFSRNAKKADVSITIVNPAMVSLSVDDSNLSVPEIDSDTESFGWLQIDDLRDNDLSACGTSGHDKCDTAVIRMYTIGAAGPGFYNAAEGYGVPLLATLTTPLTLGLNAANAVTIQSIAIPSSKRLVKLSDFALPPKYNLDGDFSNAGAGSFSANLVVEYVCALTQ